MPSKNLVLHEQVTFGIMLGRHLIYQSKFEFWCKTNWESLFWTAMSWAFQSIQMASSKAACVFLHLSSLECSYLPLCQCWTHVCLLFSVGLVLSRNSEAAYNFPSLWAGALAWQWVVIVSMKNAVVVCSGVEIGGLHALSAHVHTRFDCQQRSVSWISGILEVFRAQVDVWRRHSNFQAVFITSVQVSLHYIRVAFPDQKNSRSL